MNKYYSITNQSMTKGGKIIEEDVVELADEDFEYDFEEEFDEREMLRGTFKERGVVKNIIDVCEKVRDNIAKSFGGLNIGELRTKMRKGLEKDLKRKPSEIEKWGAIGLLALGMNGDAILRRVADHENRDFFKNFNYSLYEPFSSEKLAESNQREVAKYNPEEIKVALENLTEHELQFVFPDVFDVKNTGLGYKVSLNLVDQKNGVAFLNANYFAMGLVSVEHIVSRDGEEIVFRVKADDLDLMIAQDKESIEIIDAEKKNNVLISRNSGVIGGVVNDKSIMGNKDFFVAEGGGVLVSQRYEYQVFLDASGNEIVIKDVDSLTSFLKECSSKSAIMRFFETENTKTEGDGKVDMRRIGSMRQLIEVLRLIGDDDSMYIQFVDLSMDYYTDLVENENLVRKEKIYEMPFEGFRHPLLTLKVGGGDCDDFTMLSYLRAHVNGHEPYVVRTSRTWFDPVEQTQNSVGHVFVAYLNKKGELVVMDNDYYENLGQDGTIQKYVEDRVAKGFALSGTKIDWVRRF